MCVISFLRIFFFDDETDLLLRLVHELDELVELDVVLRSRNTSEKNLAICSHSAFFMHQFQPYLPEMMGLISYEDKEVERLMMDRRFDNCELRTVAFQTAEMAGVGL